MSITRAQIVVAAREYINTPFEHQGRIKGVAVDCVGLIFGVAINTGAIPAGSEIPNDYRRGGDGALMETLLSHYMDKLDSWTDAGIGDVLAMAYSPAIPQHCMIVTARDGDEITVIEAGAQCVVEHRLDASFRRRMHSAYRVKGLVD